MTIEDAVAALHRLGRHELDHNPLLAALLQKGGSLLSFQKGGLRGHKATSATEPNTATAAPGSGVFMALTMLNDMISEAEHKLDLEEVRCAEFEAKQLELMEQTRQDIAAYNAIASEARAEILAAQTQIEMLLQKIPELNDQLAQLLAKCASEISSLRAQLAVLEGDIAVINRVVAMTNCAQSSSLLQLNLIRCEGKKSVQFVNHALNKAASSLKSDVAKQGLQRQLAQIFQETKQVNTALTQFNPPAAPTSAKPEDDKATAKCSVASSPVCHKMLDRFLAIQTDIVDKRDSLSEQLKETEERCETDKANFEAQIATFETRLKDQQAQLAMSTKKQNDAEEQSRLKSQQLVRINDEYVKTMEECKGNIEELHSEICGAKKIRKEIYKMSDLTALVSDCEVSDWVPGECTVTCGGGMQMLNRSISILPAYGGAECPPLTMDRVCNDFPCPIDCEVDTWSGWSTCSADCGGGVKQRVRAVITQPQNGGVRCGETSEAEPCNMQSCDRDCELADWTAWGPCSKECDGGLQERVRHVAEPPHGQGTCPDAISEERTEYLECNTQPCIPFGTSPNTPLHCGSAGFPVMQDIVILLDGSGSLGEAGWNAVKAAGVALANAFYKDEDSGAKVAVELFGGPRYWSDYDACTGHLTAGQTPPNMATTCGLSWVTHFSTDSDEISDAIAGLDWPQSTTFTSGALAAASNELSNGRADAQSIVFVITDGRPLRRSNTRAQSKLLREKARLIWIPVTKFAPIDDVMTWASHPPHENVIVVDDFETLSEQATVNDLVSTSCPDVHV